MKLEVGKMYITRDGQKVGPMKGADNKGAKFYADNVGLYFEDGTFGYGENCRCKNLDIVADHVERIEPLSTDAFRRIIEMLNGSVDAALDDLNFDDAIEYAVMMRECERMMRDG